MSNELELASIPLISPSSSSTSTPESDGLTTPLGLDGDVTPQPKRIMENKKEKTAMLPPPVPVNIIDPTPPRLTRLPSLKQLSDRLHPSLSPTSPAFPEPSRSPSQTPRLALSTNLAPLPCSTLPFAPSPSNRLKLPPSAMKRSLSSQSGIPSANTTPGGSGGSGSSSILNNTDPFASTPIGAHTRSAVEGSTSMSRTASADPFIKGYKDVPSLADIRDRAKERGMSVSNGSDRKLEKSGDAGVEAPKVKEKEKEVDPTEQELDEVEDALAPQIVVDEIAPKRKQEHPLRHSWTLFYDSKSYKPDPALATPKEGQVFLDDYEKSLLTVGKFDTVEGFARYFNNIRLPSQLARNSNYHLFKNGIRPMWEDPANANGGKWILLFRSSPSAPSAVLDTAWANLTMALVGEMLDPEDQVCGIVASNRPKIDRLQIWTRTRDDSFVEKLNALGKRVVEYMALEGREVESMSMEFQYNASNSTPLPGKFMHIPFPSARQSFSNAPPTPSRLGMSHIAAPRSTATSPTPGSSFQGQQLPVPSSLPPTPRSPTSSSNRGLAVPGQNMMTSGMGQTHTDVDANGRPAMRRSLSGQGMGMGAFSGPMGGGGAFGGTPRGSFSAGSGSGMGLGSGGIGLGVGGRRLSATPSPVASPAPRQSQQVGGERA